MRAHDRGQLRVLLSLFSHLVWNLQIKLGYLASEPQGSFYSVSPARRLQAHHHAWLFKTWVLGTEFRSLGVCRKQWVPLLCLRLPTTQEVHQRQAPTKAPAHSWRQYRWGGDMGKQALPSPPVAGNTCPSFPFLVPIRKALMLLPAFPMPPAMCLM